MHLTPSEVWQDYLLIHDGSGDWQDKLNRYEVNTVLVDTTNYIGLIRALRDQDGWKEVFYGPQGPGRVVRAQAGDLTALECGDLSPLWILERLRVWQSMTEGRAVPPRAVGTAHPTGKNMLRSLLIIHVLVFGAFGAAYALRPADVERQVVAAVTGRDDLPAVAIPRREPLSVSPLYDRDDMPAIVSEEEVAYVLKRIRPRFERKGLRPNLVEHALRTWGVDATFGDPAVMSGADLAAFLTDHGRFLDSWGEAEEPLLQVRPAGDCRPLRADEQRLCPSRPLAGEPDRGRRDARDTRLRPRPSRGFD